MSLVVCEGNAISPQQHPIARVVGGERELFLCACRDETLGHPCITLPEGQSFRYLLETRPKVASHTLVVGPSGVGKSTVVSEMIDEFPGKRIVISADEGEDSALTNIDARLKADKEMETMPAEAFASERGAVFIFDDIEGRPTADQKSLTTFRRNLYTRGRKFNVSTVTVAHVGASGHSMKDNLSELTHLVLFPKHVTSNTRYLLDRHCSLPRNLPELIRGWGHSVKIAVNDTPQWIMGHNMACVLDHAELERASKQAKRF